MVTLSPPFRLTGSLARPEGDASQRAVCGKGAADRLATVIQQRDIELEAALLVPRRCPPALCALSAFPIQRVLTNPAVGLTRANRTVCAAGFAWCSRRSHSCFSLTA